LSNRLERGGFTERAFYPYIHTYIYNTLLEREREREREREANKMGLEYMCQNCGVRLDPLMTKEEADFFLKAGCPMCHQTAWVLVEGNFAEWLQNSNVVAFIEGGEDEQGQP
jgi:hypothetical protein